MVLKAVHGRVVLGAVVLLGAGWLCADDAFGLAPEVGEGVVAGPERDQADDSRAAAASDTGFRPTSCA